MIKKTKEILKRRNNSKTKLNATALKTEEGAKTIPVTPLKTEIIFGTQKSGNARFFLKAHKCRCGKCLVAVDQNGIEYTGHEEKKDLRLYCKNCNKFYEI